MTRLVVDNLGVHFPGAGRPIVDAVSFAIEPGEQASLTGLSGSGKTQTALALMGLSPRGAEVTGRIVYGDTEITGASAAELRALRARHIGMVFQDPETALNPHSRIGRQLALILERHGLARGRDARSRAAAMLERVGLPDPGRQLNAFPHQLSGGMQQRVMIASALIAGPSLVIADEPTTALDATVQAQILSLLKTLTRESGSSLLLITHDLSVIAHSASRLLVLERGRLVEEGPVTSLLRNPEAEATQRLVAAATAEVTRAEPGDEQVLAADALEVVYRERPPGRLFRELRTHAVRDVSFALRRGETLAIVGESGSGKTSLARAIVGLVPASAGRVALLGENLPVRLSRRSREALTGMQLVFQSPLRSLNPTMRVSDIIAEPIATLEPRLNPDERRERVTTIAGRVGIDAELLSRRPPTLSGGQAQRVALARALIVRPSLLVADEAVAALDAPVRQQIFECLAAEQRERGMAILFISHDLGVVRRLCHRVMVMYLGRVVESGDTDRLFRAPRHPYTRALLDAVPALDGGAVDSRPLGGEPASIHTPPPGCGFEPRCRYSEPACAAKVPPLGGDEDAQVACLRAAELDLTRPA